MKPPSITPTDQDESGLPLPRENYLRLIAANDERILSSELNNGRSIVTERSGIHLTPLAEWASEQQALFGYDRPFAVVALGGTGRGEITPCSDLDVAFLFDDAIEGNEFLLELQRQTLHTRQFYNRYGFCFQALPFCFEDIPAIDGKQLNAFIDMAPVHDPAGLADKFRERIRETFDPFEHFLLVRNFWRRQWEKAGTEPERLDRFDIKSDGLRLFLAGIWTLAGKEFVHSRDIYARIEDPRVLESYDFLLRLRAWIHLQRPPGGQPDALGNHVEDVLGFGDFLSFGAMLGPEATERERFEFGDAVRARLLLARRRLAAFGRGVVEGELRPGRSIAPGHPVALGAGGLFHTPLPEGADGETRSRAALSLLLISQRYELPIDPAELETTFLEAGDWLVPVPELAELFYEPRGSLADSFEFLSQIPGTEERLFPGYGKFESSLDERVMTERVSLRGALERQKIRALEKKRLAGLAQQSNSEKPSALADRTYEVSVALEAAALDMVWIAAIKLALKTKRLPVTPEDVAAREDESRPLHERFSSGLSGIPLQEYYSGCFKFADFLPETLKLAQFLVANRRAFKEIADADLMDAVQASKIVQLCGNDLTVLRALFVFTCADRAEWESEEHDPARWFNIRELYAKARMPFRPRQDPAQALTKAGYDPEELAILQDFGKDFFEGIYRHYAIRFGVHLLRLRAQGPGARPKSSTIREGASVILGVAAPDHAGIAASISGAFWKRGIGLRQAHLFSAANHGLALDFFHLSPSGAAASGPDLNRALEEAIQEHRYISEEDEASLPDVARHVTLDEWRIGLYCLRAETSADVGALIYVLTCKAFRRLGANIHGLAAHTGRGHAWVSVYLNLPPGLNLSEAREIVADWG
ncbi:MAG TPA: DUF294 nucleotidyltransferase-like domain-containing protein [Verrucomicrobiales bacterium]|nr:hypothetical protein [Verrucomicrobiae bacterium]MCP5552182.1 hypothetical protein [Akkermansiaceae bacterium]HRX53055.1 DUF294 nucleotidyltransferase-like domain-containing protein [Verrucomicrobiales bacterium]